ncbi:hypothetical protein [Natronorubrum sulfidifaciens]|nr:hypothetical protein [Natronorubrum sulfidifaciens]
METPLDDWPATLPTEELVHIRVEVAESRNVLYLTAALALECHTNADSPV